MDLLKSVDTFLEQPRPVDPPRHYRGFHPSAASCEIKNEYDEDEVIGRCMRSSYWAHRSVRPSNPMTSRGRRITSIGKMVEQWEVERYKEMGIWRGNNIKFFDTNTLLSGEVDAFVWDETIKKIIGVEIKTGYGYMFERQVIGKPGRKGKPKFDHLLQTMIYLDYFKEIPLFKLVYICRGNSNRAEFTLRLDKETGAPVIDSKKLTNGITIPKIMHRYETLGKCLEDGTLPRRDYQLQYSKERLQLLYDSRRLTKKDSALFEKNKVVETGDWNCSYCDYKDHCWKENAQC